MTTRPVAVIETGDELGEGVLWRASDQSAWWTDILGRRLHCLSWPGQALTTWALPEPLASFGFIEGDDDWLVAAFASGFAMHRPADGRTQWLARPPGLGAGMRLNDGRVDPAGRFWSGSMADPPDPAEPRGVLYRLDGPGAARPVRQGIGISNGLAWSPDGLWVYHADTLACRVDRARYDSATGECGEFTPFLAPSGQPDGAVTDAGGDYWCAMWGGGRVDVFSPAGSHIGQVAVPAPNTTCVAFGGEALDLLFVTTARAGLDPAQRAAHPHSGALFVYEAGVRGLPAVRARLPVPGA